MRLDYSLVSDFLMFYSEARRANAVLRASNLDDTLTAVVKMDGTKSELFPDTLRTLFGYDGKLYHFFHDIHGAQTFMLIHFPK